MLTKTKFAGLIMALMALSAPLVYADNGSSTPTTSSGDRDSWHHGHGDHMMAKILNLSDDQVKQLKDLKTKQKTAMKSIFEQMKTNREAFETEIVKAAPDMNKINDIQTQTKTLQSQMVDNHLNHILEIKKILTPEQFAGYMALEKEEDMMKEKMHHHFGHRDGFNKDQDGHKNWSDKDKDEDND